jgi:hypothetical protein
MTMGTESVPRQMGNNLYFCHEFAQTTDALSMEGTIDTLKYLKQ